MTVRSGSSGILAVCTWEAEVFALNASNEETWFDQWRGGGWIEEDRVWINAPRQVGVTVRTHW